MRLTHTAYHGVYQALTGDRAGAVRLLSEVLEKDRDHFMANPAMEALGLPPVPQPVLPWSAPRPTLRTE
jgi:hypothetical protein